MKTLSNDQLSQVSGAATIRVTQKISTEGFSPVCINALHQGIQALITANDSAGLGSTAPLIYQLCTEEELGWFEDRAEMSAHTLELV